MRVFGRMFLRGDTWVMEGTEPHVCIKLKNIFAKIPKHETIFSFSNTPENCADLLWFTSRYPFDISSADLRDLEKGKQAFDETMRQMEEIFLPDYSPHPVLLNEGFSPRPYQLSFSDYFLKAKHLLLGDDIGLGKTLSSLLPMLSEGTLPALVVVQTHVTRQWKEENIEKFTSLSSFIISGRKPFSLPSVDVYIIRYSCLSAWVNVLSQTGFKYIIFDECQELRRTESLKYNAAYTLTAKAKYTLGASATPIFNLGEEIYNIIDVLKPGALGKRDDFVREWVQGGYSNKARPIKDPQALGSYLRESHLLLRRSRREVGQELPQINKLVYTVDYDHQLVKKEEELAITLAMTVLHGETFEERGAAAREFDMRMRQITGISKAPAVAEFVKMILDNGEAVLLAGWHRECYRIWKEVLKDYYPLFFTGSESEKQKLEAQRAFMNGHSNLLIMSLRAGAGLDGLQKRCNIVVHGELDYSPQVHNQFTGRIDRPGQEKQVTDIFLVSEYGSDPVIADVLALKSSQAHGILDPLKPIEDRFSDESRIKRMAEALLSGHKGKKPAPEVQV